MILSIKSLIGKINGLLESCELGKDKIAAVKTLEYLADYTEFHFGEEEKLQEEIAYPGIKEHKAEHKKLIQVVEELHEMLEGKRDRRMHLSHRSMKMSFSGCTDISRDLTVLLQNKNMRGNSEML